MQKSLADRLRGRYEVRDNGCWEWKGATFTWGGYGRLVVDGKQVRAHRISWEVHSGPIPEGSVVCHHCDNPLCINPRHLFIGSQSDNMRDKSRKGRHRWGVSVGAAHGKSVITDEQAMEIYLADGKHSEIAARYGISRSVVSSIKSKRTWKHIHKE